MADRIAEFTITIQVPKRSLDALCGNYERYTRWASVILEGIGKKRPSTDVLVSLLAKAVDTKPPTAEDVENAYQKEVSSRVRAAISGAIVTKSRKKGAAKPTPEKRKAMMAKTGVKTTATSFRWLETEAERLARAEPPPVMEPAIHATEVPSTAEPVAEPAIYVTDAERPAGAEPVAEPAIYATEPVAEPPAVYTTEQVAAAAPPAIAPPVAAQPAAAAQPSAEHSGRPEEASAASLLQVSPE